MLVRRRGLLIRQLYTFTPLPALLPPPLHFSSMLLLSFWIYHIPIPAVKHTITDTVLSRHKELYSIRFMKMDESQRVCWLSADWIVLTELYCICMCIVASCLRGCLDRNMGMVMRYEYIYIPLKMFVLFFLNYDASAWYLTNWRITIDVIISLRTKSFHVDPNRH